MSGTHQTSSGRPRDEASTSNVAGQASSSAAGEVGVGESSMIPFGPPPRPFKRLPKKLMLQMDNSGKDNKNSSVMAFCSHLVARGHFEQVELSFLMVGHTHEDIDAFFSKVNAEIKYTDVLTFPGLMADTWDCEKIHPVPRLIQEVADYKAFISESMDKVTGQSAPIAFRFLMIDNLPKYQYKESQSHPWTPSRGRCLWKQDPDTHKLKIPQGRPLAKRAAETHTKAGLIIEFINEFVSLLEKVTVGAEPASEGLLKNEAVIEYWKRIQELLQDPTWMHMSQWDGKPELREGFWPQTNHGTGYNADSEAQAGMGEDVVEDELHRELREELADRDEIFVGDVRDRERERFVPLADITPNRFIVIRPTEEWENTTPNCVWVGRAKSTVIEDRADENYGKFEVEWWRPKHQKANATDGERYVTHLNPNKEWEKDPGYEGTTQHVEASSAIFFWATKKNVLPKKVTIPMKTRVVVREWLEQVQLEALG